MNFQSEYEIIIENEQLRLSLDKQCIVKSLILKSSGEECLALDEEYALFSATQDRPYNNENKLIYMNKRTTYQANRVRREADKLIVGFEIVPFEAVIEIASTPKYISFTLLQFIADPVKYPDIRMSLPPVVEFRLLQLPIRSREHFGEWLNVVWDNQTCINVLATSPYERIDSEKRRGYRILTADAVKDIKLEGCSAALIVSNTNRFLECVAAIEDDYDLPHGVESRRNPMLNASIYWSHNVNPTNVDQHIMYAKKGGFRLMELYYPAMFKEENGYSKCGDYDYRDDYPAGKKDLEDMLRKIKKAGITPGLHILHTHIGVKSRYVTPVTDHRLLLTKHFTLAKALGEDDDVIYVEQNPIGSEMEEPCRVLQFDGELISYEGYSVVFPYCFTGCRRGHWNTKIESHRAGVIGGIIAVSEYGGTSVYLDQNSDLQDEVAEKIADAYNSGFAFIYFDGSEGTNVPFDHHVPNAQYRVYRKTESSPIFCEGAAKAHFGWHMLSGGNAFDVFPTNRFKEKINEFPVKDAEYMQKDFTRVNFGWWRFREDTQPDIFEYGTSRAAAWDCPATIQMVGLEVFEANPRTDDILEVLRRWEDVRSKNWLTNAQKEVMKHSKQEHILLINESGEYELVPYEQITDAAQGNPHFRAFSFERDGKCYVVCWHTTGNGKLKIEVDVNCTAFEEELGRERILTEVCGDQVIIPVAGRQYISSRCSREDLVEAIRNAELIDIQE